VGMEDADGDAESYSQCQDPHSYRIMTIVSTIIIHKK
jgi:hypothetical protein